MSDITLMLEAVERGDPQASEELLPLVYDELRRMAAIRVAQEAPGQTLQATALMHEAWLQLVAEGSRTWENRAHFFGAAANAMRRILIDNARRKAALKRGGDRARIDIEEIDLSVASPDDTVLLIEEALELLEKEDPEQARIVVMKFFGGLGNEEVAHALGISERSVRREWTHAKARLFRLIQGNV
ncbi:MAG TPA: ECF-type sigma factor [Verrucomicrobiae bacterium]|jgi:RNA polymerase sigma factor (TIGR02999 family)|nr:ECF-type sigma factor [Verrucomicrobiae bacterium]